MLALRKIALHMRQLKQWDAAAVVATQGKSVFSPRPSRVNDQES